MTLLQHELTDFTVNAYQNDAFHEVSKADVLGHWSVFFFYPADFTFVCPTELEDLAAKYDEFKAIGCEIYSVSCGGCRPFGGRPCGQSHSSKTGIPSFLGYDEGRRDGAITPSPRHNERNDNDPSAA